MIRSMTGFGAASAELDGAAVTAELRSVNSRHLKLSFHLPDGADEWEARLRERLVARVSRGHVEARVAVEATGGEAAAWELDRDRVEASLAALETLQHEYGLAGERDLSLLLGFGDMLRPRRLPFPGRIDPGAVEEVVGRALDGLIAMREREGASLEEDLRERLAGLRGGLEEVSRLAPERLARERERLRAAVEELAGRGALDEDRLAREIALIADKWDIGEEIVRAGAHVDAFEEYLEAPAGEPVGKRLSFLVQELQREVNTLGAKANDPAITRRVVEMKNEVERLREQVENVE